MLKKYVFPLLLMFIIMGFHLNGDCETKQNSDSIRLFKKVVKVINSLKTISYQYVQEFIYPSENYHSRSGGLMFVDFGIENDLVGFKYQYKNSQEFSIFNNTSLLEGDLKNKTIRTTKFQKSSFEGQVAYTIRSSPCGIFCL